MRIRPIFLLSAALILVPSLATAGASLPGRGVLPVAGAMSGSLGNVRGQCSVNGQWSGRMWDGNRQVTVRSGGFTAGWSCWGGNSPISLDLLLDGTTLQGTVNVGCVAKGDFSTLGGQRTTTLRPSCLSASHVFHLAITMIFGQGQGTEDAYFVPFNATYRAS